MKIAASRIGSACAGRSLCLLAGLVGVSASPASATVTVYTDPVAWENAVLAQETGHLHYQNFEGWPTGGLATGLNSFHPFLVEIPGAPGANAIDDSPASPLSPNGSTYYRGEIDSSVIPVLSFIDYPPMFNVIGFGADWVIDGDLAMEVQGTLIPFGTFLPTGSGFLGILSDEKEGVMVATLTGTADFGMDDIRTGNLPEPGATWLLASALIGLLAAARRRIA